MRTHAAAGLLFILSLSSPAAGETIYRAEPLFQTSSAVEVTTAAVPLPRAGKVKIVFSGCTNSRHTIEANERIRILNPRYAASRLRMKLYEDKAGTLAVSAVDVFILTQAFHEYARIFYPAPQARTFRVFVRPAKGADIAVQGLSVSTDVEGEERTSINPHPTFEYGDLNTYGCQSGYGGRFYTRPDGKTVWKTGFLGYSPSFPVEANMFYSFYCRGKKYRGRKSYMLLDCHNGKDRAPVKSMRLAISDTGETTEVKIPAGTVSARLRCYCVILEVCRATRSRQPE